MTILQYHWVGKLLSFDFTVEYKVGSTNVMADALSRHDTEEKALLAISGPASTSSTVSTKPMP